MPPRYDGIGTVISTHKQAAAMPPMTLPEIGLGTWMNPGERCAESVATGLEMGYTHVDTAQDYENEADVGEGIRRADVSRDAFTVATKVRWNNLGYDDVLASTRDSREQLGVDCIDLLYIHWPAGAYEPEETFSALAELVDQGVVRHIGVSNFTVDLLEEALEVSAVPLVANQVEMHPLQQQEEMMSFTHDHDMYLVAYSPLARRNVFGISEIVEIANKHGLSPAQVSLAWLTSEDNVVPIPMADIETHLRENLQAPSIELDAEDIEMIESIEREEKYVDPEFAPWR